MPSELSDLRALVVVPTYNEVETLPTVVERALAADERLELLVVDDASPDGTGALADRLAACHARSHVLHRKAKQGLGGAYRAGFAWGLARGYGAFCEMDADLSHDPADLPRLLRALKGADVVLGSRYVHSGRVENWPTRRRLLSQAGNRYVHALTAMPIADATSGFRAYRRDVLLDLDLASVTSEGYAFQLELALRAWRAGWRIVEVPITFVERSAGASKISRGIVLEAVWRVALWATQGPRRPAGVNRRSVGSPPH